MQNNEINMMPIIVTLCVAVLVVILTVAFIIWAAVRRNRKRKKSTTTSAPAPSGAGHGGGHDDGHGGHHGSTPTKKGTVLNGFLWMLGLAIIAIPTILLLLWLAAGIEAWYQIKNASNTKAEVLVLVNECTTPCTMYVGYEQRIRTGNKKVLVQFRGKENFMLSGNEFEGIPSESFNPGDAKFVSPNKEEKNIKVQIFALR